MLRRTTRSALTVLALAASFANADEAKIREVLQKKFPTMAVESVTKAPLAGLYEVVLDGEIVYTDEKAEYFFGGSIYDIRTLPPRNLTEEKAKRLVGQTLAGAQNLAIKLVKGNGRRVLYTFEDPNCGYCKQLAGELEKLTDVTIYTFLLPILSQDSVDKSRAVWCAADRAKAWTDLMLRAVMPDNSGACPTPIERNLQLMRRFGIRGTPAIYLSNGQQIGGYIPAQRIEQALDSVAEK